MKPHQIECFHDKGKSVKLDAVFYIIIIKFSWKKRKHYMTILIMPLQRKGATFLIFTQLQGYSNLPKEDNKHIFL